MNKQLMKKRFNLICSVIALFCVISMYMPVIAPRYPADQYYAPPGSYESEYFYTGEYYCAREYWSMTHFVFSDNSVVMRVSLSLLQAMLMLWALLSVRSEARRIGLVISISNLAVTAFILISMLRVMGSCRWGVFTIISLVTIAAVPLAAGSDSLQSAQ